MSEIISGIDNNALTGMRDSFIKLDTGALTVFEEIMQKINGSISDESLQTAMQKLGHFDQNVLGRLESILANAQSVGELAKDFKNMYAKDIVTIIESTVSELNELSSLLADIDIGTVDAVVDNLNSKFLSSNRKISIENKPININMSLNVQFDALKFTTSVFTVADRAQRMDTADFNKLDRKTKVNTKAAQEALSAFFKA
jgi:hypothetical protein